MKHHLDKRAADLADAALDGTDDDLLDTRAVSNWLNVSHQFLEIGRGKGYGPPFVKLTSKIIRYRRGDVREWLRQRLHASTSEYGKGRRTA